MWVLFAVFLIIIIVVAVVIACTCQEQAKRRRRAKQKALLEQNKTVEGIYNADVGRLGGIGHQCFQVAAMVGTAASRQCPVHVYWPQGTALFEPSVDCAFDKQVVVPPNKTVSWEQSSFAYDTSLRTKTLPLEIMGRRQNPQYFSGHDDTPVRRVMTLRTTLVDKVRQQLSALRSGPCIGVHVRRGERVGLANWDVCTAEYYRFGMDHFRTQFPSAPILLVTDDKNWCKENLLHTMDNVILSPFVTKEEDFACLAQCAAVVISNSTFGWFAAYLAEAQVVAPWPWIRDPSDAKETWKDMYLPGWTVCKIA